MNDVQKFFPREWVTDVDPRFIKESQSFYLKNREFFSSIQGKLGSSISLNANDLMCEIQMPIGENYSVGGFISQKTNEAYIFVFNSNNVNFIYRVNQEGCDIVYDKCLKLNSEPSGAVTQWRAWVDVKKTCKNWAGKRLIWTDGSFIGCIDIEASIATDSFSLPFFEDCTDECDLIKLCVPTPIKVIKAEYIENIGNDNSKTNKISDTGFQFMYRWVYYDGRKSTWSDPSTFYYQASSNCLDNNTGRANCMKLRLPLGNAMVAYIDVAYRSTNTSPWLLIERVKKYKEYNSSQQQWYERGLAEFIISPDANYSKQECAFDYKFCNDKQCQALDPSDTNRVFNPFPRGAQSLFPFKESIAFVNYLTGSCPLPKSVSDNMNYTLVPIENSKCSKEYVTVKVRAIIHDVIYSRNQVIFTMDSKEDEDVLFGGLIKKSEGTLEVGWGQKFKGKQKNFYGYIEGTDIGVEGKQWLFQSGTKKEVGVLQNFSNTTVRNNVRSGIANGAYYYQEFEFKLLKGTKGFFRLCSHSEEGLYPDTSTYVIGIADLNTYKGNKNIGNVNSITIDNSEEIFIDTCAGGIIDIWDKAIVIRDNANTIGFTKSSAVCGYIKDKLGNPIEGVEVSENYFLPGGEISRTDHNGFYHCLRPNGVDSDFIYNVKGEKDCGFFQTIKTFTVSFAKGEMVREDIEITDENYLNKSYEKVEVAVLDCNSQPVQGVRVSLSGSKYSVSLGSGIATFKVRNYSNRKRYLKAVLINQNGCLSNCGTDCNLCSPELNALAPPCFILGGGDVISQRLGSMKISTSLIFENSGHLKTGGRYGMGAIARGDCGSLSFVNKTVPYLDIPKKCNLGTTSWTIGYDFSQIVLPDWVKSFVPVRTKNINPFELQWIVDKAEYLKGKVRLTIQSLNDYNKDNFLKTNTIYQYLKDDRLEFIADSNGKYYCQSLNYKILSPYNETLSENTTQPADYFNQILIEDDGRVEKILPGTIIELQRNKECQTEDIYFTFGVDFKVVNGRIVNPIGQFNTFDTYYVNRAIGALPAIQFEHHSPSDLWGDRVQDIGTAHIVNEFEDEVRADRNITISDADDFNSFSGLEKTIGDAEMGGIVAANISDDKILLFICEYDNFISQTADDLLKVVNGNVQAASGDQILSNAQPKISGKFGCKYDDIGSIFFGDGYATWVDADKRALVLHDYSIAIDMAENKIKRWLENKIQLIKSWNKLQQSPLSKYRFSTGINVSNDMGMLTVKQLRQGGIDNELHPGISDKETICFRAKDKAFYGNYSFIPELYSHINMFDKKQVSFITVLNGIPYSHNVEAKVSNRFYGMPVDTVMAVTLNKYPEKNKQALSLELQSNQYWFVKYVETDSPNFISEIPVSKFKNENSKFNAAFLNNKNSRGGLHGISDYPKSPTIGYYITVFFIRDNTDKKVYNSIDNNKRIKFDETNLFFIKFMLKEQSGFTENV